MRSGDVAVQRKGGVCMGTFRFVGRDIRVVKAFACGIEFVNDGAIMVKNVEREPDGKLFSLEIEDGDRENDEDDDFRDLDALVDGPEPGDPIENLSWEKARNFILTIRDCLYRDPNTWELDPNKAVSGADFVSIALEVCREAGLHPEEDFAETEKRPNEIPHEAIPSPFGEFEGNFYVELETSEIPFVALQTSGIDVHKFEGSADKHLLLDDAIGWYEREIEDDRGDPTKKAMLEALMGRRDRLIATRRRVLSELARLDRQGTGGKPQEE